MIRWQRFRRAFEERVGLKKALSVVLDEPIPGGARWAYVFGSALLLLVLVQAATGIGLALYYSPSSSNAWASVYYVDTAVPLGWFLRGLHAYGASAIVVVLFMHLLQVVLFGAYKAPRETVWLSGLFLGTLVFAFALTGYLLPWDQRGYWATRVATSILGGAPGIGPGLQAVVQGGPDWGTLTLTRFYALHVAVLPLVLFGVVAIHLVFFRKNGVTVKDGDESKPADNFWPKQVAYDAVFAALAVGVVALATVRTHGAGLEAPADPTQAAFPRPEWYFLALFELLKHLRGPLEPVGTLLVPGLVLALLVALPFLDRHPARALRKRPRVAVGVALGLGGYLGLTALAFRADENDPTVAARKREAARAAESAKALAAKGIPPEGAGYMLAHDPVERGRKIFAAECRGCHAVAGEGEKKAPDLSGWLSVEWLAVAIAEPDLPEWYGNTKLKGHMDPYGRKLKPESVRGLAALVHALRDGDAALRPEHAPAAALYDAVGCSECHELGPGKANDGPSFHRFGSAAWIRGLLAEPGHPLYYGAANGMPAMKAKLGAEDLDALVAYLQSLEGEPIARR